MPPKVTDTRQNAETLHKVEEETAAAARRIVATYSENTLDGVTLMSMLGIEPENLVYKRFEEEFSAPEPPKKTTRKAPAKKAATKTTAKKTTAKSTAKKTTTKKTAAKSTAKKTTTKKTATKTTAKKTTAKKTTAKKSTSKKS